MWNDREDALAIEPTHVVLIENQKVRILEVVLPPGYLQAYHTHKWAGILVDLVPLDFILFTNGKEILLSATDNPVFSHHEGQPLHPTKNIGDKTYIGLHIEVRFLKLATEGLNLSCKFCVKLNEFYFFDVFV